MRAARARGPFQLLLRRWWAVLLGADVLLRKNVSSMASLVPNEVQTSCYVPSPNKWVWFYCSLLLTSENIAHIKIFRKHYLWCWNIERRNFLISKNLPKIHMIQFHEWWCASPWVKDGFDSHKRLLKSLLAKDSNSAFN